MLAVLVATSTFTCVARAVQTIITPNAAFIGYNLAAGGNTGAIFPAANQSVLAMGVCTTAGFRGVGFASLLRVPGSFIEWTGQNSPASGANTSGFSGAAGTDIVRIDFSGQVVIEVNSTDSIRVHNGSAAVRTGNVTLIW
jgi:hypothetical protein